MKDLHPHAYKVQLRREFVEWIMEQLKLDADFSIKIIFSDGAYFHLMAVLMDNIFFSELLSKNKNYDL